MMMADRICKKCKAPQLTDGDRAYYEHAWRDYPTAMRVTSLLCILAGFLIGFGVAS